MSEDIESLQRSLSETRKAMEEMRKSHEQRLSEVRLEGDRAVVLATLKAEALRLGAHNPEDVVRLMDWTEIKRDDDGQVADASSAIEKMRRERAYLFSALTVSGKSSGSTVGGLAPRPGAPPSFDARKASDQDYAARKWQFLAGK
ncbi:phage scaffolding protein [Brytella acorum]|uniref:Phage scaffolding protein n=1 Tax=Brytella acorum TaxID=2959299 RepID=A0AA35XWM9_9PROT|nr:phage scaffolding protein [Brytella acorum]MDF3625085.1 phage scaffolding protein [Brytella acorum]CAI9121036.1 phage scaffolding protein [Brytella acorum]